MKSLLFPLATTKAEIRPFGYRGKFGKNSSTKWTTMVEPGLALRVCKTNCCCRCLWYTLFLRSICLIIGIFFAAYDFDGGFYQNPEKMVFVYICLYMGIGIFYSMLKENFYCDENYFTHNEVPIPMQVAWYCYDMALPATVASISLYYTVVPASNRQNMTERVYIINMVLMGLDFIFGKMVLVPGHLLWYVLTLVIFCPYYAWRFQATGFQTFICFVVCVGWYIALSFFTYLRSSAVARCQKQYQQREKDPFLLEYGLEDQVEGDDEAIRVIEPVAQSAAKVFEAKVDLGSDDGDDEESGRNPQDASTEPILISKKKILGTGFT